MSKGRKAQSSAEKSYGGIQKEIDIFRKTPKNYDDYFKGINVPEVPDNPNANCFCVGMDKEIK